MLNIKVAKFEINDVQLVAEVNQNEIKSRNPLKVEMWRTMAMTWTMVKSMRVTRIISVSDNGNVNDQYV